MPTEDATLPAGAADGFVRVRGARVHNLKNVDVRIPRGALVVFTGVSGSGKSSLAFGTLYAEAQRRYLGVGVALCPAALSPDRRPGGGRDRRPAAGGGPAAAARRADDAELGRQRHHSRNLLRMLYSRAGDYPRGQEIIYAEGFSPNTPEGACPRCHGLGRIYDVTERSMVPDDSLTIRERAIASWPPAWHGQNLRDILVTLGLRRGPPLARAAEEGPRLDPLYRGARPGAGVRRVHAGGDAPGAQAEGGAELHGDVHRRAAVRAGDVRDDRERGDEAAGGAVLGEQRVSGLPREAARSRRRCR